MKENHVWNITCRFYYFSCEFLFDIWYLYPRLSIREYTHLYTTQIQKYPVKTRFCTFSLPPSIFIYKASVTIESVRPNGRGEGYMWAIYHQVGVALHCQCAPPLTVFFQGLSSTKISFYLSISKCCTGRKSVSSLFLLILNLLFIERRFNELSKYDEKDFQKHCTQV